MFLFEVPRFVRTQSEHHLTTTAPPWVPGGLLRPPFATPSGGLPEGAGGSFDARLVWTSPMPNRLVYVIFWGSCLSWHWLRVPGLCYKTCETMCRLRDDWRACPKDLLLTSDPIAEDPGPTLVRIHHRRNKPCGLGNVQRSKTMIIQQDSGP